MCSHPLATSSWKVFTSLETMFLSAKKLGFAPFMRLPMISSTVRSAARTASSCFIPWSSAWK